MRSYNKVIAIVLTVVLLGGCQNFDDLVVNHNLPTSVPPYLLLTGALEHLNDQNAWNGKQGSMSAAQFYVSTYDYYGTNNYDQGPFTKSSNAFEYVSVLQNLEQMDIEAKKLGLPAVNGYSAIGKFLRAYYFNLMSQKLGDIPLSMALQGKENKEPVYDAQKDVYRQILAWLDEANSDLTTLVAVNATVQGDPFLGGSLAAWQQVVNAFELRVLVSLSKKADDPDLNVKGRFSAIIGNPAAHPIMSSTKDNVQYVYNAIQQL